MGHRRVSVPVCCSTAKFPVLGQVQLWDTHIAHTVVYASAYYPIDVLSAALDAGTGIAVVLVFFWWVRSMCQGITNIDYISTTVYNIRWTESLVRWRYRGGGVIPCSRTHMIGRWYHWRRYCLERNLGKPTFGNMRKIIVWCYSSLGLVYFRWSDMYHDLGWDVSYWDLAAQVMYDY